jgi:hypothetical protein
MVDESAEGLFATLEEVSAGVQEISGAFGIFQKKSRKLPSMPECR